MVPLLLGLEVMASLAETLKHTGRAKEPIDKPLVHVTNFEGMVDFQGRGPFLAFFAMAKPVFARASLHHQFSGMGAMPHQP
jgi:hypothetical protein